MLVFKREMWKVSVKRVWRSGLEKERIECTMNTCMVCGNPLPPRRQRYCSDLCRTKRWKDYWTKKTEEGKKTSGYRPMTWGYIRDEKLRLSRVCERCGSKDELEVHHIIPLKLGGSNELSNLRTLCMPCHGSEHPGKPKGKGTRSTQGMLISV